MHDGRLALIGCRLPGAIGATLGAPDNPAVETTGDASTMRDIGVTHVFVRTPNAANDNAARIRTGRLVA
jgi:thiamine pyrophosphate-dependent acetolactate synthase large subunit-like protein